jgi:hypothetical protein
MEPPTGNGTDRRSSVRHYAVEEYPTGPGVRSFVAADQKARAEIGPPANGRPQTKQIKRTDELPLSSSGDLGAIDLLFCDSITYGAVKHPRRIMHRLLSDESLHDIASAAESLVLKATARKK